MASEKKYTPKQIFEQLLPNTSFEVIEKILNENGYAFVNRKLLEEVIGKLINEIQ